MGVEYQHLLIPRDNSFKPSSEQIINLVNMWVENGYVNSSTKVNYSTEDIRNEEFHLELETENRLPEDVSSLLNAPSLRLQWDVSTIKRERLQYPMKMMPDVELDDIYYNLELFLSDDYVHYFSETLDPISNTFCQCGIDQEYSPDDNKDIFDGPRIARVCECGKIFRPQEHYAKVMPGISSSYIISDKVPEPYRVEVVKKSFFGSKTEVRLPGGGVYRFAISIDCGKCFPTEGIDECILYLPANEKFVQDNEDVLGVKLNQVGIVY